MMCQNCGKRPANVHTIINDNGLVSDKHLCLTCAHEMGAGSSFNIGQFISAVLADSKKRPVSSRTCPKCGMDQNVVMKSGKLGCEQCYKEFSDIISPTLERIHGKVQHMGKIPSRYNDGSRERELETISIKNELNEAVKLEDYERAAILRDKLRALSVGGDDGAKHA